MTEDVEMEAVAGALPSLGTGDDVVGRCLECPVEVAAMLRLVLACYSPEVSASGSRRSRKKSQASIIMPLMLFVSSLLKFISVPTLQPIPQGTWQPPCPGDARQRFRWKHLWTLLPQLAEGSFSKVVCVLDPISAESY